MISAFHSLSSRTGFLELTHMPLSGDQPNDKFQQYLYFSKYFDSHVRHEKIAQHDCFYKNMYDYKFISMIDPDELIVPQEDYTIPAMLRKLSFTHDMSSLGSMSFNHSYFFTNFFPRPMTQDEYVPR